MNSITAVLKPWKLDDVVAALHEFGFAKVAVEEVKGFGTQKGHSEIYRGSEYTIDFLPKLKLTVLVDDDRVSAAIEAIAAAAKTGITGDGKLWIQPLEPRRWTRPKSGMFSVVLTPDLVDTVVGTLLSRSTRRPLSYAAAIVLTDVHVHQSASEDYRSMATDYTVHTRIDVVEPHGPLDDLPRLLSWGLELSDPKAANRLETVVSTILWASEAPRAHLNEEECDARLVMAIIPSVLLDRVTDRLANSGVVGMTATDVRLASRDRNSLSTLYLSRTRIEILTTRYVDEKIVSIVNSVTASAGVTPIWVVSLSDIMRIRTGQRGAEAI